MVCPRSLEAKDVSSTSRTPTLDTDNISLFPHQWKYSNHGLSVCQQMFQLRYIGKIYGTVDLCTSHVSRNDDDDGDDDDDDDDADVCVKLLSCAVIAVGIYLTVEKVQFVSYTLGTELIGASCYLIISAASIIFLISFIGCFATLFKNRTILLVVCTHLQVGPKNDCSLHYIT